MTKRKPPKSEFDLVHCSHEQIKELKNDISGLEKMLVADKASGHPKIQDEELFQKQIRNKQKILEDHAPTKFKGQKANTAFARAKELKKIIQDAMPKERDFYREYPGKGTSHKDEMAFEKAVQQQIKFQTDPKIQKATRELKHINRRLDPDDPTITNLEALRK